MNRAILSLVAIFSCSCTATRAIVSGKRTVQSQISTNAEVMATKVLTSERTVAKVESAKAEESGIVVQVQARPVCPEAVLIKDRYEAVEKPKLGKFLGAIAIDSAIGAGVWWSVSRTTALNPDMSPNQAQQIQNKVAIGAGSVVAFGALAWSFPLSSRSSTALRTEYRDVWCGDWTPQQTDVWEVSVTSQAIRPTQADATPENWIPSQNVLTQRSNQLNGKFASGLSRRSNIDPISGMIPPKKLNQLDDVEIAALPLGFGSIEFGNGDKAQFENGAWLLPAPTLAAVAWQRLIRDADGRSVLGQIIGSGPGTYLVQSPGSDVPTSGGVSSIALDEKKVEQFVEAWACASAMLPEVEHLLAKQDLQVAASAVLRINGVCPKPAEKLKAGLCQKVSKFAMDTDHLPEKWIYSSEVELCGPDAWTKAAWRILNDTTSRGDWGAASKILEKHEELLTFTKPVDSALLAVLTSQINEEMESLSSDLQYADENSSVGLAGKERSAINDISFMLDNYAKKFPARKAWVSQQRSQLSAYATAIVKLCVKAENFDEANSFSLALSSALGEKWQKQAQDLVKKGEAAVAARAAAEERRLAAEERREAARAAAEERAERARSRRNSGGSSGATSWCSTEIVSNNMTCAEMLRSARQWCGMTGQLCTQEGMQQYINVSFGGYRCRPCH
jgi:hypothetical protein